MGNIHETFDRIGAWTPRTKVLAGFGVLLAIGLFLAFVFGIGSHFGERWSESKYLRERERRMEDIKRHERSERELAAENAFLKKQHEATAQILADEDKKRAAEAARRFTEIQTEKNKKLSEIDMDQSFDSQFCGLCSDAIKAGRPLTGEFCKRCAP